jgi:hypothetical protein
MVRRVTAYLRSNLLGALALFVALGGTSYAAVSNITSGQIKDNTIQGKDIRNGTIRSADVGDHSLLRKDFRRGQVPAGKNGSELGWARVRPDGTIASSSSPSVVAKLPHLTPGTYCFATNFTPHAFNATIDSSAGDSRDRVGGTVDAATVFTVCPPGSTTVVSTWQWKDSTPQDRGFYIVWN